MLEEIDEDDIDAIQQLVSFRAARLYRCKRGCRCMYCWRDAFFDRILEHWRDKTRDAQLAKKFDEQTDRGEAERDE